MKLLNFEKLDKVNDGVFIVDTNGIQGIKANVIAPYEIYVDSMPHIDLGKVKAYILVKNNSEVYITKNEFDGTQLGFVLQQEVKYDKIRIKTINSTIGIQENNVLYDIVEPTKEGIKNHILNALPELIAMFPNSESEITWYKDKIATYIQDKCVAENKAPVKPIQPKKKHTKRVLDKIEYNGKTYNSLLDLCKDYDYPSGTLYSRLKKGMTIKEAMETPRKLLGKAVYNMKG